MITIKDVKIPGFQKVIEGIDLEIGLHCFVAIHDTTLGPALGGTRIYPYKSSEEALNDVLRLAKAMTYKSAIAQDGLGGGKSVIIADPEKQKNEKLLLGFAEVIHHLKGQYIAAEDVGSNTQDMTIIHKKTPYVAALPTKKSSGDPSRFTAWGVFRGMQAVSQKLWGTCSLKNKKILIQGLGSVGGKLANLLFWEGAELIFCEINEQRLQNQAILYGAEAVSTSEFMNYSCDIFAPCALGGIINEKTFHKIKCRAIAGAANNQLEREEIGDLLMKREILYAPDYVINAGGIINAAAEFDVEGYNPKTSRDKVNCIYNTLLNIFEKAEAEHKSTSAVAAEIAEYNIKNRIGARTNSIQFKNNSNSI